MPEVLEIDMRPGGSCGDSPSAALGRLATRVDLEKPQVVKVRIDPSSISINALKVLLSPKGYELSETIKIGDRDSIIVFSKKK